jgi:hypothetical protein
MFLIGIAAVIALFLIVDELEKIRKILENKYGNPGS